MKPSLANLLKPTFLQATILGFLSLGVILGCQQKGITEPGNTVAAPSSRTTVKKPVINDIANPNPANPNPAAETVTVKKVPILTRNGKTYHPASLHKNNTTLVLAYQNDIRADYLIMDKRSLLDEDQIVAAKNIAMEYDRDFKRLLAKRSELLQSSTSPEEFEQAILDIRMDTADLSAKIRSRIYVEILTPEQIVQLKAKFANDKTRR